MIEGKTLRNNIEIATIGHERSGYVHAYTKVFSALSFYFTELATLDNLSFNETKKENVEYFIGLIASELKRKDNLLFSISIY